MLLNWKVLLLKMLSPRLLFPLFKCVRARVRMLCRCSDAELGLVAALIRNIKGTKGCLRVLLKVI